jgi:glycosyltransferase involved in cell wall biosynthesis
MNKPKILHIPQWYPNPDDIQLGTFIQKQIIATAKECNNFVLSIVGSTNISDISLSINDSNKIKEIQVIYCAKGNAYKRVKFYLKALQKGLSAIADAGFYPDLVHCHIAGKNLWIAEKYFKNTPVILSEHWSGYLDGRFEAIPRLKKKKRIRRINNCKEVLAVSKHLADAIRSKGIQNKISIVDNVIETNGIREKTNNEKFSFLMVADLVDETKNISGVIRAFSKVLKTKSNSILAIIGDGKDKKMLSELVKKANITDSVNFIGRLPQEDVLDYYLSVDCVIVNSNFETYSMVTAEAILSGVPVIASRCKGPEQFINENNGLLIELNNSEQLENAMNSIQAKDLIPEHIANSLPTDSSKELVRNNLLKIYQNHM